MTTANRRLKELGGNRMSEISKFYGCDTEVMRHIFKENPQRFDQMVTGFVQVNNPQHSKIKSLMLCVKFQYRMNETVRFTVNFTTWLLIISSGLAWLYSSIA